MLEGVGSRMRDRWLSQGLSVNDGASPAAIAAFEARYQVVLPNSFREYIATADGFDLRQLDDDVIRFWSLAQISPLTYWDPKYAERPSYRNPESFFCFADWAADALVYFIRLTPSAEDYGKIYALGLDDKPEQFAESFEHFVDHYLARTLRDQKYYFLREYMERLLGRPATAMVHLAADNAPLPQETVAGLPSGKRRPV
jgi:hypothetical protein